MGKRKKHKSRPEEAIEVAEPTHQQNTHCPLCERELVHPLNHHLTPRSRGGKATLTICVDCHRAIHARFDTHTLERSYSTIDALLSDTELAGTIKFISKQDPHTLVQTKTSKSKRRRGN